MKTVAVAAGVNEDEILGHDLFLYNREKASVWGASGEFISCGRLDDLQCAYASLRGFLTGKKETYAAVHCVLDNEETGSTTKQGAASTFLSDTLERICGCLDLSREDYLIRLSESFMLSADNAHAVHPNHPDKADPSNRPYLNEGIVLKFNASQKYCTDGISAAMFRDICKKPASRSRPSPTGPIWRAAPPSATSPAPMWPSAPRTSACPSWPCTRPTRRQAWRIQNI